MQHEYVTKEDLLATLSNNGEGVFEVSFTKKDGTERFIRGQLVQPIEGELKSTVVLGTPQGFKSFSSDKVTSIEWVT